MLNIYYGSETADKAKFIFEHIKGRTLLLVPDQFSLQAEKDAFFYLKEKSLMDLIVVDFSSLGHKVVTEAGGRKPAMIDKYGRHMLLTKIISSVEDELRIFKGFNWKNSFIDMMNSLISEMKRYGVVPEDITDVMGKIDEKSYLKYKLEDVEKIYSAYQEFIADKYLDSEDYIDFYGEKIMNSQLVAGADVWIYGFDTFTPKNISVIQRLLKTAKSVNIVLTFEGNAGAQPEARFKDARFLAADDDEELFGLTGYIMSQLKSAAEEVGESVDIEAIDCESKASVWNRKAQELPVVLAETSNIYAEAERAAAFILDLVRDEGYKFGDIVVVCNDYDLRGGILKRTFLRWGIPVFMDKKRKVMHHPAVGFLLALMETVAKGYKDDAVMRMMKSGLMDLSVDEAEFLENYVREFRIKGTMWKKDFTRYGRKYVEEDLMMLNALRCKIVQVIETAKEYVGVRNKAGEKIKGLYGFLEESFLIMERLEAVKTRQKEAGLEEGAAETAQSWNVICNIFDQIIETLGEEKISNEELLKLMAAGFEEIEIGLVPTNSDCVIIGTLQRTRLNRIKALVVTGANEGILPMAMSDDGLLSDREKEILEGFELELSKRDDIVRQEERLAIYRTLSLPQEKLYMSCARMDEAGEDLRPSQVFTLLEEYVAENGGEEPLADLGSCGDLSEMIVSKSGTLAYVADALRNYYSDGEIDDGWLPVLKWYEDKDAADLNKVRDGVLFDNSLEMLGDKFADDLYRGDKPALEVSASRLEGYSKCPFAHFVKYGLRAEELSQYGMGAGEIGDVYHECLMRFSRRLTPTVASGVKVSDPGSPWMTITKEECRAEISHILTEEMKDFREGIMSIGPAEEYRTGRITEICSGIAWTMVEQVRKGSVKQMRFEQPFGRGCALPPVKVDVGDKEVLIRGKIDRMDIMESSDGDVVRIVDYKTGSESINIDYMRSGYKLQLMVYLKAAMQQPAGVFYFKIKDVDVDADTKKVIGGSEALADRIADAYKLEGIVVDDDEIIETMDSEIDGASQVIPVKISKKEGGYVASGGGQLFTQEEFAELEGQVDKQVERICREICDGSIEIAPKIEKEKDLSGKHRTSCKYCSYKSICMFDISFAGCGYKHA